jgi:hypothetical protein
VTEVFPYYFLSCKANARVKLAKTGHGPHSSTLFICVVRLLFVLFSVLFVCTCVRPPGDNPIAVNKYIIYNANSLCGSMVHLLVCKSSPLVPILIRPPFHPASSHSVYLISVLLLSCHLNHSIDMFLPGFPTEIVLRFSCSRTSATCLVLIQLLIFCET